MKMNFSRDIIVERALRFIELHLQQGVSVKSVAQHVGVARKTLERRFVAATGEMPGEHIRRRRLFEIAKLLVETQIQIGELSQRFGFRNASALIVSFRKQYGMTPQSYRESHIRQVMCASMYASANQRAA